MLDGGRANFDFKFRRWAYLIGPTVLLERRQSESRSLEEGFGEDVHCVADSSRINKGHASNRFNIDINRVGLSFLVQSCSRRGVTSFDYASLRRTWHACLVPTRLDGEAIGAVSWAYRQM